MDTGRINIDLAQTAEVKCNQCGNNTFLDSMLMRKISGLLVGATRDQYIPISVFSCTKCGHVNEEFIPKDLKPVEPTTEEQEAKVISLLS